MRRVFGISAVLLMCLALSSCSGNRPEKAFMGTWEGTQNEEPVELSLLEKDIFILKIPDGMRAGTWTINSEGNAVMVMQDQEAKGIATIVSEGKIIVRAEDGSEAVILKKSDSKKE